MLSSGQNFGKKFLDSKHVLKVYFKPSRKNQIFLFEPLSSVLVWLKILLLSAYNKTILFILICFLERCVMSRYDVNLQFYGYHDGMGYWPKSELDLLQGQQFIFAYYVNSDVSYYQQIPVLSFWGFLSSAGGSIGLFLGFSCYSTLFTFTDFIKAKFQSTVVTQ